MCPKFRNPISIPAEGEDGDVFLVSPASPPGTFPGPNRIFMGLGGFGQNPSFTMFSPLGRNALTITAEEETVHLRIGSGEGVNGALTLFDENGNTALRIRANGSVEVAGDILLLNADCAEDFDVSGAEEADPGTVMVFDQEGSLQQSRQAYDKRVAGVVSGADGYRSGIILDKQVSEANRIPVALMGKVYCRVDAQYSPIEVGDLLTTSPTPGHAMKAVDALKAFGAVIGKALKPLDRGVDMIPILVTLQ
jgi:hypothetical protein